jgi:excisionase family DNA binding protein
MKIKQEQKFLTVRQLAKRWSISEAHAYRTIERGELPSMRVGQAIRVPLAAVESHERQGAPAA